MIKLFDPLPQNNAARYMTPTHVGTYRTTVTVDTVAPEAWSFHIIFSRRPASRKYKNTKIINCLFHASHNMVGIKEPVLRMGGSKALFTTDKGMLNEMRDKGKLIYDNIKQAENAALNGALYKAGIDLGVTVNDLEDEFTDKIVDVICTALGYLKPFVLKQNFEGF